MEEVEGGCGVGLVEPFQVLEVFYSLWPALRFSNLNANDSIQELSPKHFFFEFVTRFVRECR